MNRTKQKTRQHNLDSVMDFEDYELQSTMQEFLEDEKKENTNIWNFATIAGIAMFFLGMMYVINSLFLEPDADFSDLIEVMPFLGGILVAFVGFGFFVGDRKKKKRKKKGNKRWKSQKFDFDFESDEYEDYTLNNDLGSRKSKRSSKAHDFDPYAFVQSKKLYKSRTDKKWAGVCGGLAKYFGISSTVIRLLFVITFFASSGTTLLAYIALAFALDKEPPEMMDDFDY